MDVRSDMLERHGGEAGRLTYGAMRNRDGSDGAGRDPAGAPAGMVFGARQEADESVEVDDVTPRRGLSIGSVADMTARELGAEGERIAASVLEQLGYEVVARNWTCPYGEVDIIALDDDVIVFVEVKTRVVAAGASVLQAPELAVDERKQARYERMARWYLGACLREGPLRFDIMALSVSPAGIVHVRHIVDAFGSGA